MLHQALVGGSKLIVELSSNRETIISGRDGGSAGSIDDSLRLYGKVL